jgi:hypothetical protein
MKNRRTISVYVTNDTTVHQGTYWVFYSQFNSLREAYKAAERSFTEGKRYAKVVETELFENPSVAP